MAKSTRARGPAVREPLTFAEITIAGFKSIIDEHSLEIRPLTLLAGANSSGKSSILQPLLLLKQTLEAPYDPGALLLDGPNVQFTEFEQMLFRSAQRPSQNCFSVGMDIEGGPQINVRYCRGQK